MPRVRTAWACWLVTRIAGIAIIVDRLPYPARDEILGDPGIYAQWSEILAAGQFPEGDVRWQYPPLAAVVIWTPRLLPTSYTTAFALLALAMDLLIMWLLTRRGRRPAGAWAWVAGLVLLGPLSYVRYDLMVTIVAVLALLLLARHRVFGALAAVGAMLKVWPVLLLFALPRNRRGAEAVLACAVTGGVILLAFAVAQGEAPWSFLDSQVSRGLECEALAATPLMLARLSGWQGTIAYQYGSMELVGPHVSTIAAVCLPLTVAGLAVVAVLVWRGTARGWDAAWGCDAAFAAVLVAVATSRVLSPQYMLWLLGLGAVCLAHAGTRQRIPAMLILAASALSQFLYPWEWHDLMAGAVLETWVLAVRNVLVLAATVLAVAALRRTPPASAPPLPAMPAERSAPPRHP
jgi:uncharacterized membrane protein